MRSEKENSRLIDFYQMRNLIKQVPRQLADYSRIMSSAIGGTTHLSDMPRASGYSADRIVNAVIKLEDAESAYHEAIDQLQQMRKELKPYVDSLQPSDRALMRLRYMMGYSLDEMANDSTIHMDKTTVWRHLRESEKKIEKLQRNATECN